jgi:hypothetical protein
MQTKQCEVVPDTAGVPCDDGMFCTVSDACDGEGQCAGGGPNDCGMNPSICNEVVCDEGNQSCSEVPAQPGMPCQDPNDLCIKGATCNNGLCIGGTLDDCFFSPVPDDCHVAVCNPMNGMCEPQVGNEGLACTDLTDLCTVNKTCMAGLCQGGSPKNCSQLTMGCQLGVCDITSGQCVAQNLMNGDPCDDLNPCSSGETCQNGSCAGGTPVTQCTPNDNCCPMGCNVNNDADCAITDLDIGPYGSTYTSGSGTRGYWFQAPVSFTIKELRVPTDVGTGPQNIQVVKFLGGPPPDYSASTTNHQTLALHQNVPGTNYIVVNIPVQAGDYIGILGARGTTSLANSYAQSSTYATFISGQPVTLKRLIYQANLFTTAAGPLSNENGGNYSRIEMKYGP